MKTEHTASIDFQSRQPQGLDLAQRIQEAKLICDAFLSVAGEQEKIFRHATEQYRKAYGRLRELRAMADRARNEA